MRTLLRGRLAPIALAAGFTCVGMAALAQTPPAAPAAPFTLTSPDIKDGQPIDKKFAGPQSAQLPCGGENVSPALNWSNPPANTKSFAVIVFDFEGGRGPGVVHWIAYNIAPDVTGLAQGDGGAASAKMTGGVNARQTNVYFGGCGPNTDMPHHYIYSVYALDVPKDELPAGLTRDQFLEKVKGRVLNLVSIIGSYRRP